MIHPDSERFVAAPEIGLGVRATRRIPRGTIVWTLDCWDVVLTPAALADLSPAHRGLAARFGYYDVHGRCVVCWDDGRYVNHGCDPTVRGVGSEIQIAVRDIEAGEEITCDYAECNVEPLLTCRCTAATCRGRVSGRDLLTWAAVWDADVRAALVDTGRVAQPLWPFLLEPQWLRDVLDGRRAVPSLRGVYRADEPDRRRGLARV